MLAAARAAPSRLAAPAPAARMSVVAMASTPRQKATKRHVRARPIKYTPADRNRKPHEYEPLPPPPPEVVVVSKAN
ncbi:PSRP6 [Scenedesmus sp. PABB004]|nr:PSRP6 [Scenedesmus sp. PABB004]